MRSSNVRPSKRARIQYPHEAWKIVRRWALLLGMLIFLLSPAPNSARDKAKKPGNLDTPRSVTLVWPLPPQPARIRFVQQIQGVDDVIGHQRKQRWMDRLAGVRPESERNSLKKPYGIAVDSQGKIYVADSASRMVYVFDLPNKTVEYRGNRGPGSLSLPIGVALDDKDRLFVSDSYSHKINTYSPEGTLIGSFGTDVLQRPAGLAIDNQRRRLYIADAKAHQIVVFDTASFAFVKHIGEPGPTGEVEDGKFSAPSNIAVDSKGLLYVTDTWNFRIQVFDPEGKFVRAFGEQGVVPGKFVRPKGIAIDREGHVYVADAEFNNFQVLTPEGLPLLAVGGFGIDPGQFVLISGMAIDKNNRIYVTEQWRGRLQIFEYLPERAVVAEQRVKP